MGCTHWVQPLVEQGADQGALAASALFGARRGTIAQLSSGARRGSLAGEDEVLLVEDEAYEEPVQVQEGIVSVLDDVYYGQLPVPSLGGGIGYGAPAVDCWTLPRGDVPADVVVPVSEAGVAPWTH